MLQIGIYIQYKRRFERLFLWLKVHLVAIDFCASEFLW